MSDPPKEPPNPDRTIIRPGKTSGADGPAIGGAAPRLDPGFAAAGASPAALAFAESQPELFGPEPIVAAASRLIRLGGHLRGLPLAPDLTGLRKLVVEELKGFAARAQSLGFEPKTVQLTHYILCAFIDDAVMTTPWGANSVWSQHSLLAAYHNDVKGGERLFQFAERMEQDPAREPRVMELLYLCLSLGFEGRMALDRAGEQALQEHRRRMHQAIAGARGRQADDLSPQWRGETSPRAAAVGGPPAWTVFAGLGFAALLLFAVLLLRVHADAEAALAGLGKAVGSTPAPVATVPAAPLPGFDQVERILAPDIASGRVTLARSGGDVIVRLANQGLFASGTADPSADYSATYGRLGRVAQILDGPVAITGHTDNQHLRTSLAYPSNQALSEARADVVAHGLAEAGVARARMEASGVADSEPIADNATQAGRQANRRVEVRLRGPADWR